MSYADILHKSTKQTPWQSRRTVRLLQRVLQPGERPHADETSAQPAESPLPPLEFLLSRSLVYLTKQTEYIQEVLSAVSQDASGHLVPEGDTHHPPAMHSHHLGRLYVGANGLKVENRCIKAYLIGVAKSTAKARRIIDTGYIKILEQALSSQKAVTRRAIHQNRGAFKAVAYTMVCELKAARLAGQWHKVWTLERRLASTASMFILSQPLAALRYPLPQKGGDARMTEISMSRMAGWDDSYASLYEEDASTRKGMNLARRYLELYTSAAHEKPWQGETLFCAVKSPDGLDRQHIILRQDQSSPPSPLWPRDWKPSVLTETESTAESNPTGMTHEIKRPDTSGDETEMDK
jgi:hypothetical protein